MNRQPCGPKHVRPPDTLNGLFTGSEIMKVQPFVLAPDQRNPALSVLGTQVTILASNDATQSYGITLQQGDEGTGPPPHSHDWDESFYVLKGKVEFLCEGKAHICMPGTLVHVKRFSGLAFNLQGCVNRRRKCRFALEQSVRHPASM